MWVGYLQYECQRAGITPGWWGGLLSVEFEHYRTLLSGTGNDVEGRMPLGVGSDGQAGLAAGNVADAVVRGFGNGTVVNVTLAAEKVWASVG